MDEVESYSPAYVEEMRTLLGSTQDALERCLTSWEDTLALLHAANTRIAELVDDNAALRQSVLDAEALLSEARSTPTLKDRP